MSWVVAGVIAASTAYGGYMGGQKKKAAEEAAKAAAQIKREQEMLLNRQKELADEQNLMQYSTGATDITTQSTAAVEQSTLAGQQAETMSGLETGTAMRSADISTGKIIENAQSSLQKLVATRELAADSTRLDFQSGQVDTEKDYAQMMAGIDPGGVGEGMLEGFMGSIGTGAIIATSDRRLKENIDHIGNSPSGIKVYEFNYLNNDVRYRGVIANELVDSYPNAVSENKDGYYMIDYSQIDVDFEIIKGD